MHLICAVTQHARVSGHVRETSVSKLSRKQVWASYVIRSERQEKHRSGTPSGWPVAILAQAILAQERAGSCSCVISVLGDRGLVLVHRTRRDRVSVAFLVQAPCGLFDCLSNLKVPCGPKAGMEHGVRGF